MYRKGDISATHNHYQVNPPDEPQFEGVVFTDGTVAVRWRTAIASISVWDSMESLLAIHGHPEYDSELIWLDEERMDIDINYYFTNPNRVCACCGRKSSEIPLPKCGSNNKDHTVWWTNEIIRQSIQSINSSDIDGKL